MSARDLVTRVLPCGALALVLATAAAPEAGAVIIASGDGTGNTTAPDDDFGFANVGDAAQTAVYLGDGWVITANHVALGPVELAGVRYEAVPGSKIRMKNEGPGVSADLALWRLEKPWPPLPPLRIRSTPVRVGEEVVLAGNGYERGEPVEIEGVAGWRWAASQRLRWGTNRVAGFHPQLSLDRGTVTDAFSMEFDLVDATPHEAQVAVGDSGGAVFTRRDGRWELAGVLFAANSYPGQPSGTALYGNVSLAADLAAYRDQILEVIGEREPAPASCQNACGDGFALSLLVPVGLLAGRRRATRRPRRAAPPPPSARRRPRPRP